MRADDPLRDAQSKSAALAIDPIPRAASKEAVEDARDHFRGDARSGVTDSLRNPDWTFVTNVVGRAAPIALSDPFPASSMRFYRVRME